MFYEGAEEVNVVSGYVLAEDGGSGVLVWHKIEANLSHPDVPNVTDAHRVACGEHIFGVAHPQPLGHTNCSGCGL
jgi:hypothetical protein